ncbi:hypothetical protein H4S14_002458 [Agrobacterium vitis]|nr:hypothetical protein [Agrobacterium vitis]MBE1438702.1 hypothetical protein [Agrobacterium vitis]
MFPTLRRIASLFRKEPTLAEALRRAGFRSADIARLRVAERRNREQLLRHRK